MGLLGKTIFASEAFFAYVILAQGLVAKLRAIRHIDRGTCQTSSAAPGAMR
jgi:hypothetical protein